MRTETENIQAENTKMKIDSTEKKILRKEMSLDSRKQRDENT